MIDQSEDDTIVNIPSQDFGSSQQSESKLSVKPSKTKIKKNLLSSKSASSIQTSSQTSSQASSQSLASRRYEDEECMSIFFSNFKISS